MIYTAYIKSDDRGISRGIKQGTRQVNEFEKVFFDASLGLAYVFHGPEFSQLKVVHPANMGGDSTYFIHLLQEQEKYESIDDILAKLLPKKEEKIIIVKEKKKVKGA